MKKKWKMLKKWQNLLLQTKQDFKTLQTTIAKLRKELENAKQDEELCEQYSTENVELNRENSIFRQKLGE